MTPLEAGILAILYMSIGLVPAVLLRFCILRRPLSFGGALGICSALMVGFLILVVEFKWNRAFANSAPISFFVLRWGASKTSKAESPNP